MRCAAPHLTALRLLRRVNVLVNRQRMSVHKLSVANVARKVAVALAHAGVAAAVVGECAAVREVASAEVAREHARSALGGRRGLNQRHEVRGEASGGRQFHSGIGRGRTGGRRSPFAASFQHPCHAGFRRIAPLRALAKNRPVMAACAPDLDFVGLRAFTRRNGGATRVEVK
jgi:hypothetical protein